MYLKSIEIQGFKSFANRMLFAFHNGITGIVGPNGSGKSNVADAVRWVLGEQRIKQLRGASMQDVIFSGTELRKPQGFAYAAITLDNSDHQLSIAYDEVTVSRRLYRSGESEYKINGSLCRLKDINELFYDTGIGKEGYSIIGQGQIDRILSGKPEERRELFDEAAGIVKFKRRKGVAQKKLEDEQSSLVRISDILTELEKQVGPLERQSKAAREYLQLRDRLKLCDANLFLMETKDTQAQLSENETRQTVLKGDLAESHAGAEAQKAEYDRRQTELEQLDSSITADREKRSQGAMLQSNLEGQINVLREQIRAEERNEEHLRSRKAAIGAELAQRRTQLEEYDRQLTETRNQAREAGSRLEAAEKSLAETEEEIRSLESRVAEAKNSVIQTLNDKAELKARRQRYETMLEQVNLRRSQVAQQLLRLKSDESVQEEQLQKEEDALRQTREQLEKNQLAAQETEDALNAADQELRRLNRRLNDTQQAYHMAYTRLESLRNLAERYDGYGGSIRRVMEVRDRIHGIHGVVADLISTRQEYETAIETALGGTIQNIVTDSETTAKRLIEYLKKNRYGRATFLPLTSIGGGPEFSRPEALKEKGVLGLASQLVQAKKQYEGLVGYLLGRVVLTDTIDNAIALARAYRYSLRIVTLEGELLSAGGSMTGGAFKNTSNLLGRRRELEELEKTCQSELAKAEKLQGEIHLQETVSHEKKGELEQLREENRALLLRENTLSLSLAQLEEKKQELAESSTDLVREHGQLEEQSKEIEDSCASLKLDDAGLESRREAAGRNIEEDSGHLEEKQKARGLLAEALSRVQVENAEISQKQDFIGENVRRVSAEIRKLEEENVSLETGSGGSRQIIQEREAEILQLKDRITHVLQDMEQLEAAIKEEIQRREDMSAAQKKAFAAREELTSRIASLDKDLFRVQSQREKLEERLESAAAYMWNEYELTYSDAALLRREEYAEAPELRKQIETLKSAIKGLGSINVNAIEDYREISERYEFMRAQHADLTKAREELEKIITELDAGMRRQFQERFRLIQAEFNKVFQELFGGGRGTLELMEDEDLLEAGIQIIAQPPGKKLQNMMQLSGGEKALTAISLLFAIQNLKPSPFCLLDEIEAALDDSNVDRFAGYLHKLTRNTQFIVITHRRGTMVSADRLYGITMQEKGVSTLVSVNLIEDELKRQEHPGVQ